MFKDLPMPLYHIHGNHDLKKVAEHELNTLVGQEMHIAFTNSGIRHIIIKAEKRLGAIIITNETFEWLKQELDHSDMKVIIYCHYPMTGDRDNLGYYHKQRPHHAFVQNSEDLRKVLEKSGKVLCVLSGHTHFYYNKIINGIRHITIPSFSEDKGGAPCLEFGVLDLPSCEVEIVKASEKD